MMDIATGTLGAALLGVLLALLLVVCDRRIRTGADVKQRLGFPTLLDLDGKVDPDVRVRQMQHFANSLRLVAGSDTAVVAVVGVRQSMRSAELAQGLAATASSRRSGAILICADLNADLPKEAEGRRGLVEVLGGQMNARAATIAGAGGLAILPAGNAAGRDPYGLFDPERMVGVVEEVSRGRHFVAIDAPAVLDATESQIVCAAADRVVVVIERGTTRWADLKQAVALLGDVRAQVAGVAIVEPAPRKRPEQAEPAEPDGMVEHAPTYTNGTANHPAPPEARTETLQHVTPAPDPRPRPVSVGSASGNGQNRATDGTGNG
jgi:Mrp family chromosome partitioning ATPase